MRGFFPTSSMYSSNEPSQCSSRNVLASSFRSTSDRIDSFVAIAPCLPLSGCRAAHVLNDNAARSGRTTILLLFYGSKQSGRSHGFVTLSSENPWQLNHIDFRTEVKPDLALSLVAAILYNRIAHKARMNGHQTPPNA